MKDESQAVGGYLKRVPEARRERALAPGRAMLARELASRRR